MLKITLKQLELFISVAESGSFTQAAEDNFMTQSTVSVHIASLESALGAPLFIRDNHRRVSLTSAGRDVYEYAKDIVEKSAKLEGAIGEKGSETLRIGASSVPSSCLLPSIMADFAEKYPKYLIQLRRGDSVGVHEMIRKGDARIGFVGTVLDRTAMDYIKIADDTLVIITPANDHFRALKKSGAGIDELISHPLILREKDSGSRREFERYLQGVGIDFEKLNIAAEIDQPSTIVESVAAGVGISVISSMSAKIAADEGRVMQFDLDRAITRGLYLVTAKDFSPDRAEKDFIDLVVRKFDV